MKALKTILFTVILISFNNCANHTNTWYTIEKIDKNTFIISEPNSSQKNSCFLIVGDNKAFLIDAGSGENKNESIHKTVSKLTNKPVTLILSHFHFDHIGCINEFDSIAILSDQVPNKDQLTDTSLCLTKRETLYQDSVLIKTISLIDTQKDLNLGNREIQILYTPGHSPNSITVIDKANRYIFAGDLIYNGLLLIDDMENYLRSIDLILSNSNDNFKLYGAHGRPQGTYNKLIELKQTLTDFRSDSLSYKPVKQTDFYGSTKNIYRVGDISFINGYTDVFLND
ncbi:MBL fold metallo-hydrolase [Saccharicrinis sp. FJH62]|uniref:MBL fold metallo-hydrolase n=1 Tax=Saccharicrinis sp. FJH62 TaxID=3344657 RepID=UPI0035D3F2D3